ncbi:ATP-binding protein [Streptomyces sp. INA 01156]
MRRNGENLLVLAGEEPGRRWTRPVPLVDVLRAAASEVEQYERIELTAVPTTQVAGRVVNDLVHLLAELLENATSFSSPQTKVKVTGHALPDGRVLIEIHDTGIGLSPEDLAAINERLASPPTVDVSVSRRMGLFVVGRLSQRHGIRIQLRPSDSGGTTALVMLPVDVAQGNKKPQGQPGQPGVGGPAAAQAAAGASAARRSAEGGQSGGGALGGGAPGGGRLAAGQGPRAALPGRDGQGRPGARAGHVVRRVSRAGLRHRRCSSRAVLPPRRARAVRPPRVPATAVRLRAPRRGCSPRARAERRGRAARRARTCSAAGFRAAAAGQRQRRARPSSPAAAARWSARRAARRRPAAAAGAQLERRERPAAGAPGLAGRSARPRGAGRLPHQPHAAVRQPPDSRRDGRDAPLRRPAEPRLTRRLRRPRAGAPQNTGQYARPDANNAQFARGDAYGTPSDQYNGQNPSGTGQFAAPQGYDNGSADRYPAPERNGGAPARHALPERPNLADPASTGQFERPQPNGPQGRAGADFGAQRPAAPQRPGDGRAPSDAWALPPASGPGDGRTPLRHPGDQLVPRCREQEQGNPRLLPSSNSSSRRNLSSSRRNLSSSRRGPPARSGPSPPPGAAHPTTSWSGRPNASGSRPRAASPLPAFRAGCQGEPRPGHGTGADPPEWSAGLTCARRRAWTADQSPSGYRTGSSGRSDQTGSFPRPTHQQER